MSEQRNVLDRLDEESSRWDLHDNEYDYVLRRDDIYAIRDAMIDAAAEIRRLQAVPEPSGSGLSVAEWTTLRDLLSRAATKVRNEVRDSSPEYRNTIDLSLGNVEHVVACELAHATGQPCPVHKAVQP